MNYNNNIGLYIPCYNAAKTIEKCIESIISQSYPIQQILVIDDGSKDNSTAIIKKYFNIRLISHSENRGLAAARNTAIQNLQTELIANIDADCIAEKNWLEKLLEQMQNDNIAAVGGKLIEINRNTIPDYWRMVHMRQHWGDKIIFNPDWLYGHSGIYRRSVLLSINGYDEKFKTNYEDLDLSRRLRNKKFNLLYTPEAVVYHLRQDTALSVLNTRWRWTALGVHGPVTRLEIIKNIGRNIGRAMKYIYQDTISGRFSLLGLDFALGFYSSYADLRSLLCR